jgi:hypothetical protein
MNTRHTQLLPLFFLLSAGFFSPSVRTWRGYMIGPGDRRGFEQVDIAHQEDYSGLKDWCIFLGHLVYTAFMVFLVLMKKCCSWYQGPRVTTSGNQKQF